MFFSFSLRCFSIVLIASVAGAQMPFEAHDAVGHAQDAVVYPSDGSVYMAVSDQSAICKINPETSEILKRILVDKGVSSLAVSSDGETLGCVSGLSNTVSFIRLTEDVPYATGLCPKGACDIAALPEGRFVVSSSFTDEIAIFSPSDPENPQILTCAGSVPVALAATEAFLAVIVRIPASLEIFPLQSLDKPSTLHLIDTPVDVVALPDNRFALATASHLAIVDARKHTITFEIELAAKSLCADDDRLFALTPDAVVALTPALDTIQSFPLARPGASVVAACGDFIVALTPGANVWQAAGRLPQPEKLASAPSVQEKEEAAPPVVAVVKAGPVVEKDTAPPVEEAPAETVPETPEPVVAQAKPSTAKKVPGTVYRRTPLTAPEVRAPRPGRRPDAMPTVGVSRLTLSESLNQKFALDPAESIQPPDWTQPLRDVEADNAKIWKTPEDTAEYDLEGNVRLRLDTMKFTSDKFRYSEQEGHVWATGNVLILQDPTILSADEIEYQIIDKTETPHTSPLVPHLSEQEQAKLRLSLGKIEGSKVTILQPTQELVADHLVYDVVNSTGELENAHGRADIYYFNAKKLRILGPASLDGEDVWVTTCDHDPPHYRLRVKKVLIREGEALYGRSARLQLGGWKTPLYWPRWGFEQGKRGSPINIDFDSGRRAEIGYFVNVAQQFTLTPESTLGVRLFPTTKEGVGFGIESEYDFTQNPASPLFLGKGEFRTLYTTKDRGYGEFYHRHKMFEDTVLLLQAEQWSDRDFYKDFYYPEYRNRTMPRTFANVTYTKPTYIATGTVHKRTHSFVHETERLPEATFHLLERPLTQNLYFSFDTINGYYEREPRGSNVVRSVHIGRLTYDLELHEALNITPFFEMEGTWYSEERYDESSNARFGNTIGATVQTRLHKAYPGIWGFSGFKHVVVPSVTYFYRPEPTMGFDETPRFDSYDSAHGRSRIETKLANVLLGKDAETEEIWQVARLTLYQGNDFWNELPKSEDYEAELDIRPRPWWGWLMAAEYHGIEEDRAYDEGWYWQRRFLRFYDRIFGRPYYEDPLYQYDSQYGDYSRLLTYLYYDQLVRDGWFNAHLGFAYTETREEVFNREVLYGLGCKLGDHWGVAFEHRYDFERDELAQQKYEIRRSLHCWEAALLFRDRQTGWDVSLEFNISAFPGTRVKF